MGKIFTNHIFNKGKCAKNIEVAITHYLYAYLPVWTVDHILLCLCHHCLNIVGAVDGSHRLGAIQIQ